MWSPGVPLSLVGSSLATGATGATVSLTTVMPSGLVLVLPAGSVAVTFRALRPSGSAVVGVAAQVPSAATVVVFHNHPSGDPTPSTLDRLLTRRLDVAGEMLGIELGDHIILGDGTYFSFKEEAKR